MVGILYFFSISKISKALSNEFKSKKRMTALMIGEIDKVVKETKEIILEILKKYNIPTIYDNEVIDGGNDESILKINLEQEARKDDHEPKEMEAPAVETRTTPSLEEQNDKEKLEEEHIKETSPSKQREDANKDMNLDNPEQSQKEEASARDTIDV